MHIKIIPLQQVHALTSYQWRNDKDIWVYTISHTDKEITLEMETQWIETVLKRTNEKRFAILADDVYIGNTQLTDITKTDALFHIFIGEKNYWGKGISTRAMSLILDKAKEMGLKSIYLWVNTANIAALKVYKKNGFTETCIEKNLMRMEKVL